MNFVLIFVISQTIILSYNEIRRDGALAVANSMKNKTTLKLINLDGK